MNVGRPADGTTIVLFLENTLLGSTPSCQQQFGTVVQLAEQPAGVGFDSSDGRSALCVGKLQVQLLFVPPNFYKVCIGVTVA